MVNKELKKFYTKLHDQFLLKYKTLKDPSLLISLLSVKSNDRLFLFNSSKINRKNISSGVLSSLLADQYVKNTDEANEYVISAKGLWKVEIDNEILTESKLLISLDTKFFDLYKESEKDLSDRQKVVLFSMIAARAFSSDSVVDLKLGINALDAWSRILVKSYEFLKRKKLLSKLTKSDLTEQKGNEHPVSNIIRHTDNIPKRTRGLFKAISRDQKYYLDLYNGSEVSLDDLGFLFNKIFGDLKVTHILIDEVAQFCESIAYSENIYIFDVDKHKFAHPSYDRVIRDALRRL